MQQIAAQITDVAALPFADSKSSVKGGAGDLQHDGDNSRLFTGFFQQAKANDQGPEKAIQRVEKQGRTTEEQASVEIKRESEPEHLRAEVLETETGETPLTAKDKKVSTPAQFKQNDAEKNQFADGENVERVTGKVTSENGFWRLDMPLEDADSKSLTSGKRSTWESDLDLQSENKTESIATEEITLTQQTETNWIEFVENVSKMMSANSAEKSAENSVEEGLAKDIGTLLSPQAIQTDVDVSDVGETVSKDTNVSSAETDVVLQRLFINTNENGVNRESVVKNKPVFQVDNGVDVLANLNRSEQDNASLDLKERNTPFLSLEGDVSAETEQSLITELTALLAKLEDGTNSISDISKVNDAVELKKISHDLLALVDELSVKSGSADEPLNVQSLNELVKSILGENVNTAPVTSEIDQPVTLNNDSTADASLVVSLFSDALKPSAFEQNFEGANDVLKAPSVYALENDMSILPEDTDSVEQEALLNIQASVRNGEPAPVLNSEAPSAKTESIGERTDNKIASETQRLDAQTDLMEMITNLPQESAQKATEAFADRMVAILPNAQQQAVKANIIAGINEFQQQIKQGHEPGIDLSAIVTEATKDTLVNNEAVAAMVAKADVQANQLVSLINQTQNTASQMFQTQHAQVDTVMSENSQLRAEATKSQQQFEGFDKAVNIHKPEGQQQLNEKIRWMVNARNTMAEIRLDPPELGSMQVRVNVSGDAASVSFIVQSQHAKEALADAMPKLRDMLSEQGIELGDAQVRKDNSSENGQNQQFAGDRDGHVGNGTGVNGDPGDEFGDTTVIEQSVSRQMKGGIDFYA